MLNKKPLIILFCLGFLLYIPTLFNGFVWDDEEMILNNPQMHSITNWPAFFAGSTFNSGGAGNLAGLYYKPLMTTVFSAIYTLFGPNAAVFHLVQILIHLGNTMLLFLILKIILKKPMLAFIVALIFLVHPINAEAVVYLADYQDAMYFFFGALSFYLILTREKVYLPTLLILLSLLSKETGVVFATMIFIYLVMFDRQKLKQFLLGIVTVIAVYSYLRFGVANIFFNKHGLTPMSTVDLATRMLSVPQIIFTYLKNFFFPVDLAINQQWIEKSIDLKVLFLDLLFFAGLIIFRDRKNLKLWFFFFIWFLLGLGFHLQIFPLDLTVSDRWFYFPIVGLLVMIVLAVKFNPLILIVILLLAGRTFIREFDWRSGLTLYSHDIKISRNAFDLENNLGVELFRIGQYDEAKKHFEESVKLSPQWWTNWNNLGAMVQREGNYKLAEEYYWKSVNNGQYYLAYENLANIIFINHGPQRAKEFTVSALQYLPQNANLWRNLALAEQQLGNSKEATAAAQMYMRLTQGNK